MKRTQQTLDAVKHIHRVETTGHVRLIGSEMLLGLYRGEIPANDVEAGARMIAAISLNMHTEIKLAIAADNLRQRGADLAKVAHMGSTLIGQARPAA